jgi:rfaE bifunctional protein kinase chain/domain
VLSLSWPRDFPERHGFAGADVAACLTRFTDLRVLVVGDLIVDEYVDCEVLGLSQEEPVVVVAPVEQRRFVGGAAIVAAHARGLGARSHLVTVSGEDEVAGWAAVMLDGYGVDHDLLRDDGRPTTLKQRFRATGKTLLRLSHVKQHAISAALAEALYERVAARIADCDLLVFSDFNYGCLPQQLVDRIGTLAATHGVVVVADSQASHQLSDVSRFKGMALITPTEREARLAVRDAGAGLPVVAEALRRRAEAGAVVITLGAHGILVHAPDGDDWRIDRLPAFNPHPADPAGAGDSFLICSAMALCAGAGIWPAVYLGSVAAACQVSRIGNAPLSREELAALLLQS